MVGFEPNPSHTGGLIEIQQEYAKCGWSVHFYTETAVSNYNGVTDFYTDNKQYNNEMGAGIVGENVNLGRKLHKNCHYTSASTTFLFENFL